MKYKDEICRVCGKKTLQYFNINFKIAYICQDCEHNIVKQSIIYNYNNLYNKRETN